MTTKQLRGMIEGMTNAEYHAAPGISKSKLDLAARSPRHYWARFIDPNRGPEPAPTPAMVLGTATHTAILEPEAFAARFVAAPEGIDRRTNAGKAAWAEHLAANVGKETISVEEFQRCNAMRAAALAHPIAGGLLEAGAAERSFFGEDRETSLIVKCRPDFLPDSGIGVVDIKTTRDASPGAFGRSAAALRYDVQAAWYLDVLAAVYGEAPEHFIFIAIESEPPYAIGVYHITPEDIAIGREKARRDLARIFECSAREEWPDYAPAAMPLVLPRWAAEIEP